MCKPIDLFQVLTFCCSSIRVVKVVAAAASVKTGKTCQGPTRSSRITTMRKDLFPKRSVRSSGKRSGRIFLTASVLRAQKGIAYSFASNIGSGAN